MSRLLLAWVLVAATYLLALASLEPLDVAAGAVVGVVAVVPFRRFLFAPEARGGPGLARRLAGFGPLLVVALRDITVGTWKVALVVLHLRPLSSPGIVAIPIGERTQLGVAVSAFLVTLSPGEFLVDVDRERGVMLLHVLDASDPDAVRRRQQRFYDRWQRTVFP